MEFTCQIWHFGIKRTLFAGSRSCVAFELCCGNGVWSVAEFDSNSTSVRKWVELDSAEEELGQKHVDAGSLLQTDRLRETQGQGRVSGLQLINIVKAELTPGLCLWMWRWKSWYISCVCVDYRGLHSGRWGVNQPAAQSDGANLPQLESRPVFY